MIPSLPSGVKPYGSQLYIHPDTELIYSGNSTYGYEVLGTKAEIEALAANLNAEALTRASGDEAAYDAITAEANRASLVEDGLREDLDAVTAQILNIIPSSTPTAGVNTYNASAPGTYTNFGGVVVSSGDLDGKTTQIRDIDGVWTKFIIPVNNLTNYTLKVDFEDKTDQIINGSLADYLLPFLDKDSRLLGGLNLAGKIYFARWVLDQIPEGVLKAGSINLANLKPEVLNYMLQYHNSDSGYVLPFLDKDGRLLAGFRKDASLVVSKWADSQIPNNAIVDGAITEDKLSDALKAGLFTFLDPATGYLFALLDLNNRRTLSMNVAGQWELSGINISLLNSRVSNLELYLAKYLPQFLVLCIGDSITFGQGGGSITYPYVLQNNLGSNYQVVNLGVGGEDVPTIAARIGAVPLVIKTDIVLPGDRTPVNIGNLTTPPQNLLDNSPIKLLLQNTSAMVNPVIINNRYCILKFTNPNYTLELRDVGTDLPIHVNTPMQTVFSKTYNKPKLLVLYVGTNGGYDSDDELIDYINRMINFVDAENYLVIGMHARTRATGSALEIKQLNAFSLKFINFRDYISTFGLAEAGITPTTADLAAMAAGGTPPSLIDEGPHLNPAGYTVLGNLVYHTMQNLKYI